MRYLARGFCPELIQPLRIAHCFRGHPSRFDEKQAGHVGCWLFRHDNDIACHDRCRVSALIHRDHRRFRRAPRIRR